VPPVDPNNQDTSVLSARETSRSSIILEGDPRVLDLTARSTSATAASWSSSKSSRRDRVPARDDHRDQEKVIPAPGRHGMVYVDTCIVAHSNEAEWQSSAPITQRGDPRPHRRRQGAYNLRLSEEVKIYQKIIRNSDFRAHVAPHTLEVASMFAILSRLEPTGKCDLMTKLKLYNGEEVVEKGRTKKIDVRELRDETKREGMSGISTRFIMKALDNALSDNVEGNCINPINVRESLIAMVKEGDLPDDTRQAVPRGPAGHAHKEYLEVLEKEITARSYTPTRSRPQALFQNYLDHAEAFVNKTRVKDRNTKEELQPDEGFLKSIEEQIAIIGSAADGFRQEVIAYLWQRAARRPDQLSELRAVERSDREEAH